MSQKLRVVLYMDANVWAANENRWYATSQPGPTVYPDNARYQIVVEIPDPRGPAEVVRGEVTEVTPAKVTP